MTYVYDAVYDISRCMGLIIFYTSIPEKNIVCLRVGDLQNQHLGIFFGSLKTDPRELFFCYPKTIWLFP